MSLTEFFGLNEGKEDIKYRSYAGEVCDLVAKNIGSKFEEARMMRTQHDPDEGRVMALLELDKLTGIETLSQFVLVLQATTQKVGYAGAFHRRQYSHQDHIIRMSWLVKELPSREEWESTLKNEGNRIFTAKQNRETFVHEFTHYLDFLRRKDQPHVFDSETETDKYYNSSHETNAFIQAGIDRAHRILLKKGDAKDLTMQQVLTQVLKSIDQDFKERMTDKTKRGLYKRVNQFWQDLRDGKA